MHKSHTFINGSLIGVFAFLLASLLAAHLLSDCGLPAVIGMDYCADDIVRAGFPWVFFEEGGFAYREMFNLPLLVLDLFVGLSLAVFSGFMARWIEQRRQK